VENLVAEQQPGTVQSGVGLRNLQERLQLLYAHDAGLQANRRGNIFHATFDIPVR
jgi:sensor histidine kinase YesM